MKLCEKCDHSPLPFLMAFLIAAVCAFVTWLTLGLSVTEPAPRAAVGALTFLVVGAALLHYVLSCLKRHCRHQDAADAPRVGLRVPAPPGVETPSPRWGDARAAA